MTDSKTRTLAKPKVKKAIRVSWIVLAAIPILASTVQVFTMQVFGCDLLSDLMIGHALQVGCLVRFEGFNYPVISAVVNGAMAVAATGFLYLWPLSLMLLTIDIVSSRSRANKAS